MPTSRRLPMSTATTRSTWTRWTSKTVAPPAAPRCRVRKDPIFSSVLQAATKTRRVRRQIRHKRHHRARRSNCPRSIRQRNRRLSSRSGLPRDLRLTCGRPPRSRTNNRLLSAHRRRSRFKVSLRTISRHRDSRLIDHLCSRQRSPTSRLLTRHRGKVSRMPRDRAGRARNRPLALILPHRRPTSAHLSNRRATRRLAPYRGVGVAARASGPPCWSFSPWVHCSLARS